MNDFEISNIYIDNIEVEKVPEKDSGYVFKDIKCSNGIKGTWDENKWELRLSELKNKTTCKIYFISKGKEEIINPNTGATISILIIFILLITSIVISKNIIRKRKFYKV